MNITHYYTLLSCDGLIVSYDPIETINEDISRKRYNVDEKAIDHFMNETFGDYDTGWECHGITTSVFVHDFDDELGRAIIRERLFLSRDLAQLIEDADIDGNVTDAELFDEVKKLTKLGFEDAAVNLNTKDIKLNELCLGAALDRPGIKWIAEAAMQF